MFECNIDIKLSVFAAVLWQIRALAHLNVGLIATVFHEPLGRSMFRGIPREELSDVHLLTANYKAPKMKDMHLMIERAEECIFVRRKAVVIHCGGGKGRAGTGLACFVIKWGLDFDSKYGLVGNRGSANEVPVFGQPQLTAEQAIDHIRSVRPGSIETKEQEEFIKRYAGFLWSQANGVEEAEEESKVDVELEADPTGLDVYPELSSAQKKVCRMCLRFCVLTCECVCLADTERERLS